MDFLWKVSWRQDLGGQWGVLTRYKVAIWFGLNGKRQKLSVNYPIKKGNMVYHIQKRKMFTQD